MASKQHKLPLELAQDLLHQADVVHAVQMHPAQSPQEEQMSRLKALAHIKEHGAFLSGPQARKAKHALCSPSSGGWKFFETNHE